MVKPSKQKYTFSENCLWTFKFMEVCLPKFYSIILYNAPMKLLNFDSHIHFFACILIKIVVDSDEYETFL